MVFLWKSFTKRGQFLAPSLRRPKFIEFFHLRFLMASPTSWEFYKEVETKILWVNICTQNLEGVAISINKWWKTRYPAYKIRIVSKKEFELVKMKAEKKEQ